MSRKLDALSEIMPEWDGKKVLDIGCDFGFWSFLASQNGAIVTGIDRSRVVRGLGRINIPELNAATACEYDIHKDCTFFSYECGVNYRHLGWFDIVLCMSLYHHIYQNTGGDHEPIWYWLWKQTAGGGELIWENPVDSGDPVVRMNVAPEFHEEYNEQAIRKAAGRYFDIVWEGPAIHESTRVVWKMTPKKSYREVPPEFYLGEHVSGVGGASKAFEYAGGRRIREIHEVLGIVPLPGSLNVLLEKEFDFDRMYYRTLILDVMDRAKGLDGYWDYRPCRFYPVWMDGVSCFAMRFEGEKYPKNFLEVLSETRLIDRISGKLCVER